ncbi:MAG TPA: STAS domain-containing protein [Spirochaetota bacterium]|nr:STAS domain-containing protein [Spirochaetota bacterium]HOS41195.1 STAS domain-containing protein [Spirochaetota bacterium]HPI22787.1 STAS domain-containing protein [Spirochaetota bacterium]HPU90469.1 STAS domain-containing protein [Spirochaetota bacterium]
MTVREDVGVKNIKAFHADLAALLAEGGDAVLDFSQVRRIDLAVAQVLTAAQRLVRAEGRAIRLKGLNQTVRAQLALAGLAR